MAVKYHINDNDEPGECRAKTRCKFGGKTGVDNHFTTREAAEAYIQSEAEAKCGNAFSSLRKPTVKSKLQTLADNGVPVTKISNLQQHSFTPGDVSLSSVDVLDEKPTPEMLQQIRSGQLSFSKS